MSNQPTSKVKSALNFGAIIGLLLMIISLITYVFEMYEAQWLTYVSYLLLILGIVIGIKNYRDSQLNGFISYGNALGYGVLLALFASIIVSFVNYLYLGFIDDGFLVFAMEQQELAMYESGMPDDQIELSMEYARKFSSPGIIAFFGMLATTFLGFIISLIAAAVLKKEPTEFSDVQ